MQRNNKHLDDLFKDFMDSVYPDAGRDQTECMAQAFFAGAGVAVNRLMEASDLPDEQSSPIIEDLENEIRGFCDKCAEEAFKRMGTTGRAN